MLTRTFCHVQGIGRETEAELWRQGCLDWETYLSNPDQYGIGSASRELVNAEILRAQQAFEARDHAYFSKALGSAEAWRAWPDFSDSCLYVDIETDGGQWGSSVTMAGIYDGSEFKALIKDRDLDDFPDIVKNYGLIVTFFGSGFDLPMLQKRFKGLSFPQVHLDLCHTLKRLGYRGGLKAIERQVGIARVDDAKGLDGRDAIRLWREHLRGKEGSLETLIAYNREDVVNMEVLAKIAYDGLSKAALARLEPLKTQC